MESFYIIINIMKYLLKNKILEEISASDELKKGDIVRRVGHGKDQQGVFICRDDEDGLVIANVVDMKNIGFLIEVGLVRPLKKDKLYRFKKVFGDNPTSNKARAVLKRWPLYKNNPGLQQAMTNFMESAYCPDQIIDFNKTRNLKYLFIPIQQKLKIGRFEVKINWEAESNKRFQSRLEHLEVGEHMTYIATVPQKGNLKPLFYSVGTQPHESTHISLQSEPFNFEPGFGGHIKYVGDTSGKKEFLVDAGSNYFGKGEHTTLETASMVTGALEGTFTSFKFTPKEGRGAFGLKQSY